MADQGLMSQSNDRVSIRSVTPQASSLGSPLGTYANPLNNPNIRTTNDPTPDSFSNFIAYRDTNGRIGMGGGDVASNVVIKGPKVGFNQQFFGNNGNGNNSTVTAPPASGLVPAQPGDPVHTQVPEEPGLIMPEVLGIPLSAIGNTLGIAMPIYNFAVHGSATSTSLIPALTGAVDAFGFNALGFSAGVDGVTAAIAAEGGADAFISANAANFGQTTLSTALGFGMAGGTVATLLGLGNDSAIVNMVAGAAGGVVGATLAAGAGTALLGQALGSWAGPVGAAIGGFVFTALGGLFGPGESDKLAGGRYDPATGEMIKTWTFHGKKYSEQNNQIRDTFFDAYGELHDQLENITGGTLVMPAISFELGNRDGMRVWIGDDATSAESYDTPGEAFYGSIKLSLKHMTGLNENAAHVQSNLDYSQPAANLLADVKFGSEFDVATAAMLDGSLEMDVEDPALIYEIGQKYIENTQRLGLDATIAQQAVDAMYATSGLDVEVEALAYQDKLDQQAQDQVYQNTLMQHYQVPQ